jgi:signal transduction histidine kinase
MPHRRAPDGELVLPQTSVIDDALVGSRNRGRAAVRVLVAAAIAVAVISAPGAPSGPAWVALAVAAIYIAVSTVHVWRIPSTDVRTRADLRRALFDVVAMSGIACTVEEPRTAVLLLLCAIPLGHSLTLSASAVAAITAAAVSAVFAIWTSGILFDAYGLSDGALLLIAFALGWCGLVACLIAVERERRSIRISELSGSVQEMLGQAIRAEEMERQRVADLLHDDVLQILLATRHDIADAMDGELSLLPDARAGLEAATRRLRETIGGLRTDGVAAHSLGDGVRLLAAQSAERRSFDVNIDVEPALDDIHHPLLLSVVRDLLRDAERASAPTQLDLRLYEEDDLLLLVMRHDDRRFALGLDFTSDDDGELLEAVDHRVRAVAGTFAIERSADGHRDLRVVIPVRPPAEPGPEGPHRSTSPLGAGILRAAPPRTETS